jgi:signal peptidase I
MNDTDITIHTKNGEITNDVIHDYFDVVVYDKVEFYVNSDGHYQGEFGVVEITLEDYDFSYSKSAESEWTEQQSENVSIKLTDIEQAFVSKNILNLNGDESNFSFVFKGDVFLSDKDEEFLAELETKISVEIRDNEPNIEEGELNDYYSFNTEENNLTINEEGEIEVNVNYSVTIYRDSES